jgi:hypothetical protein|tara:strand:+ start:1033 stop:1260 length:228 start_codon:yes stop_codon:yes gene_type:complete
MSKYKDKKAAKFLPKEVQDAINSFLKQFLIMLEYQLDEIPREYGVNLIKTLSKYPEYKYLAEELLETMTNGDIYD